MWCDKGSFTPCSQPPNHHNNIIKHQQHLSIPHFQNPTREFERKGEKEKKKRERKKEKGTKPGNPRGRKGEFDATNKDPISFQTKKNSP